MRMPNLKTILAAGLVVSLLAGCGTRVGSWFSSRGPSPGDPAELVDFAAEARASQAWSRSTGEGERRLGLRLHPTLAEGRLYLTDPSGRVSAVDPASGQPVWSEGTGLRISTAPGVGAGRLVVGTLDGEVVALDADSGAERWRARVGGEVLARPLVSQGLAVVRANNGRVSAFDLGSGQLRWEFERPVPSLSLRGHAAPVTAQGLVIAGFEDGLVAALRPQDGQRVWETQVAEPEGRSELERMADIRGDVQAGLNEVFVASYGGQVMALSIQGGQPLWARDLRAPGGLSLDSRNLYLADDSSVVWALDRGSSSAQWRQEALQNRQLTTPVMHGGLLLVGDLEGFLHWLSPDDGRIVARTRHGRQPIRATPQVSADGLAYVVDVRGAMTAYRIARD